jgi:hypothetical protein
MSEEEEKQDQEYLEWAKKRALEYLDANDITNAFASMLSDMKKNPRFENHAGNLIGVGLLLVPGWISNPEEVRRWIVGFR